MLKQDKRSKLFSFGTNLVQGIVLLIMFFFCFKFYQTSVLSKEEIRQNVLENIQKNQQGIYSNSYVKALEAERKITEIWKNANPNDSKSYMNFRNQFIKDFEKKNIPYFETLTSDKTSDGFGKR